MKFSTLRVLSILLVFLMLLSATACSDSGSVTEAGSTKYSAPAKQTDSFMQPGNTKTEQTDTPPQATEAPMQVTEAPMQVTEAPMQVTEALQQSSEGLIFALNESGTSYVVKGLGSCTDVNVIIPALYNDMPVTEISYNAFKGFTSLISVTIPDSVTVIHKGAFDGCDSFQYNIYDNAMYLGNERNPYHILVKALDSSIESVSIHPQTTSINELAFESCQNLTSVMIPDSVAVIGGYAFNKCAGFTSVTIPDSVTAIGPFAFYGCDNLEYTVYDNALYLGNEGNPYYALIKASDSSIKSVSIHPQTKIIGGSAFSGCKKLTSMSIPNSVTAIGKHAFYDCVGLTSMTIPDGVTEIGEQTFINCISLRNVTIPDSVTTIGTEAFMDCTSLTSVTIPDSVTTIGKGAFLGCKALTSITIPDNVTVIGKEAFSYCEGLTSVTIPDSVTAICDEVFFYCESLTSVEIPDSVTKISYAAFDHCTSLKTVNYRGTEKQWSKISIDSYNSPLKNATIVYEYSGS